MRITERTYFRELTTLENGTRIGMRGLSITKEADGTLRENPQSHFVIIEEDVSIGANCTIHRGGWRHTWIQKGCRIGAQVNIGHNVIIERNTMIAPMATIAGSCEIGEGVTIWQGACLASRLKIGDGAVIGMGAVVLENVPPFEVWAGNPARKIGVADL